MSKNGRRHVDPERRVARARKGGLARAKSLTPAERKAIARKGALARWGKRHSKEDV
jgi:hypothetical protein